MVEIILINDKGAAFFYFKWLLNTNGIFEDMLSSHALALNRSFSYASLATCQISVVVDMPLYREVSQLVRYCMFVSSFNNKFFLLFNNQNDCEWISKCTPSGKQPWVFVAAGHSILAGHSSHQFNAL